MNTDHINRFFTPTSDPEGWKTLLAKATHWKKGKSAYEIAHSWQKANGFPDSVDKVFKDSKIGLFENLEFLLGIPEYRVPLPGGPRASQNDIFVFARGGNELLSIAVEGKESEGFGETVDQWLKNKGDDQTNKKERLEYLCKILQLDENKITHICYQLIHRAASAVIEAKRFQIKNALMLVHSFSAQDEGYHDYNNFLATFGIKERINLLVGPKDLDKIKLYFCWIKDEKSP